jgi:hypothetical protein
MKTLLESLLIGSPALRRLDLARNVLDAAAAPLLVSLVKARASLLYLDVSLTALSFTSFHGLLAHLHDGAGEILLPCWLLLASHPAL